MEVINTFMHRDRVLRPGDAIPDGVSNGELLAWKNNGLIGDSYDGPTRRSLPTPAETKPATPARRQRTPQPTKQPDAPKPDETKTATGNGADSPGEASTSDVNATEDKAEQGQAATDDVASQDPQAEQSTAAAQESA